MILNDNDLVFAKVRPNAIIPTKDDENAGFDIYACFDEDYMVIPAHNTVLVPTGIASAMTEKYYLNVAERGSTGSKGIKYSAGIIDSGYRGEIFIALSNVNDVDVIISKFSEEELFTLTPTGKRIFQESYNLPEWAKTDVIFYPYSKAIAQLIVHEVKKMNVSEISYEELKAIPSKRRDGSLGSSGK